MRRQIILLALASGLSVWPAAAQTFLAPPGQLQINVPANLRRVELSWPASDTAGVSYRIYRSQSNTANGDIIVDKLPLLSYIDATVNYGVTYYYRVAAVSDGLVSSLVGPVSATPNLSPPTNVAAINTEQGGEIKITWERPTAGLVLTYNVYRSASGNNLGDLIVREVNGVEYVNTGLENDTRYYYRVKAVDRDGREGEASQMAMAAPTDKKSPVAPIMYGNYESPDRAYLSWSTPPNERNLSYILYRSTSPGLRGDQVVKTSDTSYRQYDLPPGATYYYGVTATDGAGNVSDVSKQVKVAISPPSAVVNTLKVTNLTAEGTINAGEILLRWDLSRDDRIAYSRVYRRRTESGEPGQIADRVAGSSYLDKTAKAGERYYYIIRLVGKDGSEYQPSEQASAAAFDPANRSQSTIPSVSVAPVKTTPPRAPAAGGYAYGKPRMTNLRLEAALTNNLRRALIKKLGARPVPRTLPPVLVKAYLYGGYTIDEIAATIKTGPGLVHPSIRAVEWRRGAEYQRKRD